MIQYISINKKGKKQRQYFSASHTEKGRIFSTDKARKETWKGKKLSQSEFQFYFRDLCCKS